MTRTIILGALAAIGIGLTAPAQAHMANPALGAGASAISNRRNIIMAIAAIVIGGSPTGAVTPTIRAAAGPSASSAGTAVCVTFAAAASRTLRHETGTAARSAVVPSLARQTFASVDHDRQHHQQNGRRQTCRHDFEMRVAVGGEKTSVHE